VAHFGPEYASLKYDYVYLNPAEDGFELYDGVQEHINYYHDKIHHTTRETPNSRYNKSVSMAA
jgi:putative transposase